MNVVRLLSLTILIGLGVTGLQAQLVADFSYTLSNGGCTPDTASFTNNSSGATSYFWDFGDLGSGDTSTAVNPKYTYTGSGTFVVRLTAYDGSGDSSVTAKTVTVKSSPGVGAAAMPNPACTNSEVQFYIGSTDYSKIKWYFGDGDSSSRFRPTHTYTSGGTYTAQVIATNKCGADTSSVNVTVSDSAQPSSTSFGVSPSSTVCPGQTVDFQNYTNNTSYDFYWDFGDGDTSVEVSPSHAYSSPGTYTVQMITTNRCAKDTVSSTVTVDGTLQPNSEIFSPISGSTKCPGDEFSFNADDDGGQTAFIWDFGDGHHSTVPAPTHSYSSADTYKVYLKTRNKCGNTTKDSVTLNVTNRASPFANMYISPSYRVCPGDTLSFSSSHQQNEWNFGDGNTSNDPSPTHSYDTAGTYTAQLIVTNSCGNKDTTTSTIDVGYHIPPASINMEIWDHVRCVGDTFFYSTSEGGMKSVLWEFGDGDTSNKFNTKHAYTAEGDYTVMLTKTNNCDQKGYDAREVTVSNGDYPMATNFNVWPRPLCVGEGASFSPNSGNDVTSEYHWGFGDGNTGTGYNTRHSYQTPGSYTVRLIIQNECGVDTATQEVTVKKSSQADFEAPPVCKGNTTNFTNQSSGSPEAYYWDFGDGDTSTQPNPVHTYAQAGAYTAVLSVRQNGCRSMASQTVYVDSPVAPKAGFGYLKNGLKVTFGDTSKNASSWVWYFGDGDTSHQQYPVHEYSSGGQYTVKLIVKNACGFQDTVAKTIDLPVSSIPERKAINHLTVYPNPANEQVMVRFEAREAGRPVQLSLYNMAGQNVRRVALEGDSGVYLHSLEVKSLPPGVYVVAVKSGNARITQKLLLSQK